MPKFFTQSWKLYNVCSYKYRKLIFETNIAIIEWGWVGYEEFYRSRRVLSTEALASVDNTLRNLQNSSYRTKAKFNDCFIIHSKYFLFLKEFCHFALCFSTHQNNAALSPGFLGQLFNDLQRAALWRHFDVIGSIL